MSQSDKSQRQSFQHVPSSSVVVLFLGSITPEYSITMEMYCYIYKDYFQDEVVVWQIAYGIWLWNTISYIPCLRAALAEVARDPCHEADTRQSRATSAGPLSNTECDHFIILFSINYLPSTMKKIVWSVQKVAWKLRGWLRISSHPRPRSGYTWETPSRVP